jgi:hypothetical protein
MIAFEIYRNGKHVTTAGEEGLSVMTMTTVNHCTSGYMHLNVGGLRQRIANGQEKHPTWINMLPLEVGDEVRLRIVETEEADSPAEV